MTTPSRESLGVVLNDLPPVVHAFAYGSAVFPQPASSSSSEPSSSPVRDGETRAPRASSPPSTSRPSGSVVDYVLAVDAPDEWHAANMAANPSHYAAHLRLLGARSPGWIADRVGVGVHYNTLLPWPCTTMRPHDGARLYKYGVVSVEALTRDLTRWSDLFVAGRMQKPTTTLTTTTAAFAADASLRAASEANLRAALAAALLMLPETFSTRELHETLCGLSYEGDVRTAFGAEDVGKIPRVAAGSRAGLREMYADAIARFRSNPAIGLTAVGTSVDRGDCDWGQDKSAAARSALLETLPRKALALAAVSAGAGAEAAAAAIASRASPERTRDVVRRAIDAIVFRSSARQLMSGILSTSPRKSLTYALGKAVKSVASRAR